MCFTLVGFGRFKYVVLYSLVEWFLVKVETRESKPKPDILIPSMEWLNVALRERMLTDSYSYSSVRSVKQ